MAVFLWVVAAMVIPLLNVYAAVASGNDETTLHVKMTSLPYDIIKMEATDGIRYLLAVHKTIRGDVSCYTNLQRRTALNGATHDVIVDDVTSMLVQSVMDDPKALSVKLGTDQVLGLFWKCLERPEDAVKALAALTSSMTPNTSRSKRRVLNKRGFSIYPGTKWCGAGSTAKNDTDLGIYVETDKCCRTHDKCDTFIRALSNKYGKTNWYPWTVSHCKCDDLFKQCLESVKGESAARSVKNIFFNMLKIKCFLFKSVAYYRKQD